MMADNCYRKKGLRNDNEDQDDRLTNRHIQTLGLLQDLHRENGELKTEISKLEAELKNCAEFHNIARDAKAFKQKAQESCLKQIDRNNEKLTKKHKDEIMSLVSAKLQAETDWLEEREKLQQFIAQHEQQNAALTDQLEALRKHDLKVDVVNQRLDRSIEEMMELKEINKQLHLQIQHMEERDNAKIAKHLERVHEVESQKEALTLELQETNQKLREYELRMKVMEDELNAASNEDQMRHSAKMGMKKRLDRASAEISGYQQQITGLEDLVSNLQKELAERTSQLEQECGMKEKLLMLLQQMQAECNRLKELLLAREQEKKQAPERVGFREFVQMRREMNNLKDENSWLKESRKKPKSLPSLKSASPEGYPYPVNDTGQRTAKTFSGKSSKSDTALQLYKR